MALSASVSSSVKGDNSTDLIDFTELNKIKHISSQCLQNNKLLKNAAAFFFFLWETVLGVNVLFYIVEIFNFILTKEVFSL